jgi:hypothetical protein
LIKCCNCDEVFVAVGRPVEQEKAAEGVFKCDCGNGVCGEGETVMNCPADCANAVTYASCTVRPYVLPAILIAAIILVAFCILLKRSQKKEVNAGLKITAFTVLFVGLLVALLSWIICSQADFYINWMLIVLCIILVADLFLPALNKRKKVRK